MSIVEDEGIQLDPTAMLTTEVEHIETDESNAAGAIDDLEGKSGEKQGNSGLKTSDGGLLKTTAKEHGDRRKNSKYDPSVLPETDDPKKIRAQVEFYFGDTNLPTDKFMWEMTDGNTNLPIKIEQICKFGRMKCFRPISAVVAALRDSSFLEVTGPEGQEEVKRKIAYDPTAPRSRSESRSIYVKGFGDEEPSSQFDIEAFFAPYGPTNAVRLRRTNEKLFKGSVFVEFQDDETARKFLELDPKPLWKGKHQLKVLSKKEYMDQKAQEIKDGKTEPGETWGSSRGRGRGRGRGGNRASRGHHDQGGRAGGDRDPDDWKKRRELDRANGFQDRRGHRDNKGGRGRGRRDDRGPRNNDRNRERDEQNGNDGGGEFENGKKRNRENDDEEETPAKKIYSKSEADNESPATVESDKKRAPEDNNGVEVIPAKNVDSKPEVATEAS